MEISDPVVITVLGAIGTALTGTITKLYIDVKDLRTENGALRDKYQEKIENLLVKVTELVINITSQTNTMSNALTTITSNMAAFQEKALRSISDLREEFFKRKE